MGVLERLSAADASNLILDSREQVNVYLLAGLLGRGGFVSDDGSLDLDHLREWLTARIKSPASALHRFGQRIDRDGRHPVWKESAPDLSWHVRLAPQGETADPLGELCADLMMTPLAMDRPLWELLVVPGAWPGGPGVVLRVHHAVADGTDGIRLAQHLFGDSEDAEAPSSPPPAPTRRSRWSRFVLGIRRVTSLVRVTVAPTVLLGPIGPRRGVFLVDTDLARIREKARQQGSTVNDALLGAVTVAVRTGLQTMRQPIPDTLPASVPVSLPDRGGSGNAVGVMLVPLPLSDPAPMVNLGRIAALTRAGKQEARDQGTFELTRTRLGTRLMAVLARHQRFIAIFVTNVRGPTEYLSVGGARLVRAWPVAPIAGNVRLGVAALSYAGRLCCSVHLDADAIDGASIADALGIALRDL